MSMILVTGGAGFIGCHLTRALLDAGHAVRVLDILEPPGHQSPEPLRLDPRAEFLKGDVRVPGDLARALDGIEVLFHLAATGGFTDRISDYVRTNTLGTALLLEALRDGHGQVRRILVASSVAVYGEGMARCVEHGLVHPGARAVTRLARGRFEPVCPVCGHEVRSVATAESSPVAPERAYSITKYDQERLVLSAAPELGIEAGALRYFVTYGPGQSITNPYTGVISIFANLLRSGQSPVVYEDGNQTRDFIHVDDLVAAHLVLLAEPTLDGRVFNVGSGQPTRLVDVARVVAEALGSALEPTLPGRYRIGDVRHILADTTRLMSLGWRPRIGLRQGIQEFVDWLRHEPEADAGFVSAEQGLRARGLVRESGHHA